MLGRILSSDALRICRSHANGTPLAEKNLGSNFIFQDYMGLGMQIGRRHALNVELRLLHYPDGDIFTHNPGFDVLFVSWLFVLNVSEFPYQGLQVILAEMPWHTVSSIRKQFLP